MKRLLSLALCLVLVTGLFAGLAGSVSADGEIGQLFDRYLTGDKIDELFDENSVVKTGYCGKTVNDIPRANVMYKIYKVDQEKIKALKADTSVIEQNALYEKLRKQYPDFNLNGQELLTNLDFNLAEDQDYYALKLYGNGEMDDYSLAHPAPWNGKITIDGVDVDLEKQIIAVYVQGKDSTYPTGVTNIGERAFFGMDGLMMAYLGESVTTIGAKAFETCDKLSAINFPSNLESIGRRAFYACDYLTFARMNTCTKLTEIAERAFCTCSHLTEIALPPNVTKIGDFAFAWDHILGTNRFNLPAALKTIGTGAFAFCTHLGVIADVPIPASTTNIGPWAFACCFDIGRGGALKIYPGEQALTIGTGAFAGCRALTQVAFPNRVAFIGDYAFAACDTLERVSFGDRDGTENLHIRSIGDRAFDSLEDTGLSALRTVAAAFKEVDSGEAQYVDGSRSAAEAISGEVYDLSGVTPLNYAAFGSYPPSSDAVVEAKSNHHSFPRTVTIWYPSTEYNSAAYGQWRSVIKAGNPMTTWLGYNCEPMWVGHYHEYGDPVIVKRTCTQDGQKIYTCHVWQDGKECGHVETVTTAEATGHDSEAEMKIDATCLEDGIVYYHCSNEWCDHPDYTEVIPAKGHDYENLQDYTPPTCLEPGYAKGTCSRCGVQIDTVLPAKGHNTTYMTLVKEPTCTEEGEYQGNCPDCEFGTTHVVKQKVPALGHNWDKGSILRPATQTTDGIMLYTCIRCGETKQEPIPKTMHVHHYEKTVIAEATCQKSGEVLYRCDCGDEYYEELPKLPHKWDSGTVTVQPTATTEGRIKYTCTVCGNYRYDKIPATGARFVDVPDGEWFTAAVNWAVTHTPQITNGTDPTHFSPYANCTRAQAVTFLYRAAGEPAVSGVVNQFVDVHASDYYYKAVLWAVKNGITNGVDNSHFDPEGTCTRAHIVTFLWRWKGEPRVSSTAIPFSDVPRGEWFTTAVLWAAEKGITNGNGDGNNFGTYQNCTRGHIVTFLQRAENVK